MKIKPKWLIGANCFLNDKNPEYFEKAAKDSGCEVLMFKYVPFEHDKNQKLGFEKKNDCIIGYGSIQLIKLIQRATPWIPGAWCDWEQLKCSYYLTYWGEYSIHKDFALLPLGEILRNPKRIFDTFGYKVAFRDDIDIFVKPDGNDKSFHGEIINSEKFHEWEKYVTCYNPDLHQICLISKPSKIQREWRLVIANNKVITGSQYAELINNEKSIEIKPGFPKEAADFAEKVCISNKNFIAPAIFCMDVAQVGNEMKMVEIGSFNCAGLYDCEIPKIMEAANEIAVKEWEELQE